MKNKRLLLAMLAGFLIGSLWLVAVRFVMVKDDSIHYHANFALYINGQREEFKSPLYYEEVQSCSETDTDAPETRVHMHGSENSVVHVHDHAATWSHFFANLGFGLTDKSLTTDNNVTFVDDQGGKQLSFMLNGESVSAVANRVIENEDVLLISYGSENDANLSGKFSAIPKDAHEYNDGVDPGGCSGSEPLTFMTRMKKAWGL